MFDKLGEAAIKGLQVVKTILIWHWEDAPKELKFPFNGGDEDFVIVLPPNMELPYQFQNLGGCSNDIYRVNVFGEVEEQKEYDVWEYTKHDIGVNSPWVGCTIIIPCHS